MDMLAEMLRIANEEAAPILAALRAEQETALDALHAMLEEAHKSLSHPQTLTSTCIGPV